MADVVAHWIECLESAYALARGERANELRGEYVPRFDARRLHPYSHVWGAIHLCQSLEPVLRDEAVTTDPVSMRKAAYADAEEAFRAEIVQSATEVLEPAL